MGLTDRAPRAQFNMYVDSQGLGQSVGEGLQIGPIFESREARFDKLGLTKSINAFIHHLLYAKPRNVISLIMFSFSYQHKTFKCKYNFHL